MNDNIVKKVYEDLSDLQKQMIKTKQVKNIIVYELLKEKVEKIYYLAKVLGAEDVKGS